MRSVPLTQSQFALVDDSDFEWLSQWKWTAQFAESTHSFYAFRVDTSAGERVCIRMHRLILGLEKGNTLVGDHINGNTLDNRRSNLRSVTMRQNRSNSKLDCRNKSGYRGVARVGAKWRASLKAEGKRVHLGMFSTAQEAYSAYMRAAEIHHGKDYIRKEEMRYAQSL